MPEVERSHRHSHRTATATATHLGCWRFVEGDVRTGRVCVGVLSDPGVLQALGHRQPVGGFMDQQGLRVHSCAGSAWPTGAGVALVIVYYIM